MPRFYVEGCQDAQTGITIMGEDVNHIKNVLRLTIGDTITGIYHPEGGRTWSSRDCSGYDETDCRET